MQTKSIYKISVLFISSLFLTHCANDLDKKIEDARFLLDKGAYSDVVTLLTPVAADHPESIEVQFLIAASQIAFVAVGDGNSYLTLFSRFLEDKGSSPSDFATFARLSPNSNLLIELHTAIVSLQDITANPALTDPSERRKVFLQLYLGRLFEIGGVVKVIGAASPDLVCNSNPSDPTFKDGIPDDFDPNLASPAQVSQMQEDFVEINSNGSEAGFPTSFPLNARLTQINSDFNAAVDVIAFFNAAFNSGAPCTVPK